MFSSFCPWCFNIWDLADPGGTAPPRASWCLETANNSPGGVPFICKPTSPEPSPPSLPLLSSRKNSIKNSDSYPPTPNHPRAKNQTTRCSFHATEPTEITQTHQSKPAYPALPGLSCGKHNEGPCPHFPSTPWPTLMFALWPCMGWHGMPLFLVCPSSSQ